MRVSPHPSEETSSHASTHDGFLEELKKSFAESFAYDHFNWLTISPSSDVAFHSLKVKTNGETLNNDTTSDTTHGDAVARYTTTDSDIPIMLTGKKLLFDGGDFDAQSNVSGPRIKVDEFRADARFDGIDGSGYTIAVLDTGIDLDDPFFGPDNNNDGISDRIVYQYDFANDDSNASDVDGHGSNVASIAASSDGTYTGMAPGANIAALKVLGDDGFGSFGDTEQALQWVISNAATYNIVSVNMSFSDAGNYNTPVQLYGIADELSVLATMDIVVVSASGNDFYELNSIQGVAYPSADPNSLSVGATYTGSYGGFTYEGGAVAYSSDHDVITPFSQRDANLTDIFAPGAPITGAGAYDALETYHGTSQAAPHIAGIVALAQQLAEQHLGRRLTYDEFNSLLKASGPTIFDGNDENDNVQNSRQFYERVNVLALGEAILALPMDPDPPRGKTFFQVAAEDDTKPEGDGGTASFTFQITRSGDLTEADTIDYSVTGSGSNPAQASDFLGSSFPSGSVTFAVGETSQTITIQVTGDTQVEPNENFDLTIANVPSNGQIIVPSDTATIENDDVPITSFVAIAAEDAVKAEGSGGYNQFTFTVTRSGDTSRIVNVDYSVTGGAANAADFLSGTTGRLAFYSGETSKTITILVRSDFDIEPDEDFTVTLSNPSDGLGITTASADGLIINDEVTPVTFIDIAALDAVKLEGDSGATPFTFIVTRSGDISASGSVDYSVSSATPDPASWIDFFGGTPSGTINFLAGEASKTLTVEIQGDTFNESDEHFAVRLGNASGDTAIITDRIEGTILNDDLYENAFISIARADEPLAEGDRNFMNYQFEITRTGNISTASTVDYAVTGEVDGADFFDGVLPTGTVSFAPNQTAVILIIRVAGDTFFEPDESFTVNLSNPSAGSEITTASAENTILNDDPSTIYSIAALDAVKAEGDVGSTPYTFTVSRTGDVSAPGSVDYRTNESSATGDDFLAGRIPSGTVEFAAGETSKTLTIDVRGDTTTEGDEFFKLSLENPSSGGGVDNIRAEGVILDDDPAQGPATLAITAADAVKAEGDSGPTHFTFTVTRSGDASQAGSVDYAVTSAAADGADFIGGALASGSVTFAAGETSKTLKVYIQGDTDVEGDEAFTVTLSNPSAGSEITTAIAEGTILNDDAAPPATFLAIAADNAVRAEGDAGSTAFTFTVTRSGDASGADSVDYAVTSLDADGSDFAGSLLPSGSVAFLAGETSKTVTVNVAGDTDFEGDETFTVTLTNPSAGSEVTTATAEGTILNDDAAAPTTFLTIAATDAAKAEGDAGSTAFTFTMTRSGDTSQAGSVDYAVTSGAAGGNDFAGGTLPSGSVAFLAGETSKTVTVNVAGDTDFEGDEPFTVTLTNPSAGSEITTATAEGTILNDDTGPSGTFLAIAAEDAVKAEGDSGVTAFTFTVTRSGDISQAGEVDYAVSSNDAGGADFQGGMPSGSIAFAAGEASQILTVRVRGNTKREGDEDFTVTLSNPSAGAIITTASANGTILDDDGPASGTFLAIAADDASKAEGDAGPTAFTFTVTRSGDTSQAGSVDYAVTSLDADGSDFLGGLLPSGSVNFAAGQTSQTITVNIAGDSDLEGDEAFTVTLTNASGSSTITTASAQGTILDDDAAAPTTFLAIAATDAAKAEDDAGSTAFTFTVTRSGDTSQAGSVDYAVTSGAAGGNDFAGGLLPSGSVAFLAGETSKTVTIDVAGDTDFEGDEAFTVTLTNPSAGSEITTATAEGTILNDDTGPSGTFLAIAAEDAVKAEGDSGVTAFTFTVTRSGDISQAGEVDYAVSSNDAGGADFQGGMPSGSIAFAAGEASQILTVRVRGNTKREGDEDFTVTLSNPSAGAIITTASANGTILDDDGPASGTFLAIAADDASKAEGDAGPTAFTFTVTRSGDTSQAGSVDYAVTSLDADGNDFAGGLLPSGSVTFAAGQTSQTITVNIAGDSDLEGDEAFTVTLTNASGSSTITTASAQGTILDDDAAAPTTFLAIAATDAAKAEGDAGSTAFTFTVTRSGDTSQASSVDYAVTSGAAGGNDFAGGTLPSGSVAFLAGETSKTVTVNVAGDTDFEGDEPFTVTLTNPSAGSEITTATAEGTILNDDTGPSGTFLAIAAEDAVKAEGDSGVTAFTFTVTRSGDISQAGEVDYAVSSNDAGGADFQGGMPSGSIAFAAGEASQILTVRVRGNTKREGDEDFTVTLSNPSAGAIITTASANGTILDDDGPSTTSLASTAEEAAMAEDDGGAITATADDVVFDDNIDEQPDNLLTLIDENFDGDGDIGNFIYEDGSFGGDASQTTADGRWEDGALVIDLVGDGDTTLPNLSGAWEVEFSLAAEMDASLAFSYELIASSLYETGEFSQVLVSLDNGTPILIEELFGDGNGGTGATTGLESVELDLGTLGAGDHSIAIGAYDNQTSGPNEGTKLTIDDILVTATISADSAASAPGPLAGGGIQRLPDQDMAEQELQTINGV